MKVLCLGHAAYDVTFILDEFIVENTKNRVDNRVECGGGPASNAAYLLGKWGVETYFAGVVGNDERGRIIKYEFDTVNVNTEFLKFDSRFKTTSSFIIANRSNGSRTILTYRDENIQSDYLNLNFKPDVILIDGQEYEASLQILNDYPSAISVIDASRATKEIIELSKKVNYLVCSKEFAEDVTNIKIDYNNYQTLQSLYIKMKQIFNNKIIVTLEARGCLYEYNDNIKIMSSINVKTVDSTGAGDIFHGAFVYGLVKGFTLEENLKMSNIAGALSVTRVGTRYSVPTIEEMKDYYSDFR